MAEYIHPEQRNLADNLDEETRKEIADHVCDSYQWDNESRTEWLAMHAKWLRIYYQKDAPKDGPWEGSSDESLPLLAEGCTQFHSRAYRAMFPSRDIVKAIPTGKIDSKSVERAERVAKHMSWQLMVKADNYKKNKDRLLLSLPLHGSVFTKTYFDPTVGNVTENVRASDLVIP